MGRDLELTQPRGKDSQAMPSPLTDAMGVLHHLLDASWYRTAGSAVHELLD